MLHITLMNHITLIILLGSQSTRKGSKKTNKGIEDELPSIPFFLDEHNLKKYATEREPDFYSFPRSISTLSSVLSNKEENIYCAKIVLKRFKKHNFGGSARSRTTDAALRPKMYIN